MQHKQQPFRDWLGIGLLLRKIFHEIGEKKEDYQILAKGYCLECLALLARHMRLDKLERSHKLSETHRMAVEKAIKFIDENHRRKLSLSELAGNAFLSQYHFCRVFKAYTSYPPIKYLAMRRIEKARELLSDGTLTFADIAEKVGFSGPFHFSAAFKRQEGFSPLEYKKLLR